MASDSPIIESYLDTFKDLNERARFRLVLTALLKTSGSLSLSSLDYYINQLSKIDAAELALKKEAELTKHKRDLYITHLLLLQARSSKKSYAEEIKRTEQLLDLFENRNNGQNTIKSLEAEQSYPGMPASYCGLQAGFWLGERTLETVSSTVNPIVGWMTDINDKRLYWVWGGGLLRTVLSLIPEDFYNTQNAKTVANAPNRFTGYMSWTLYFARFALNSFLVIKETFAPVLTDKEKEKEKEKNPGNFIYWERFKTQWDLRKFTLLNDSIWGIANMVCFFWFKGSDGDALTLALLAFDLFISIWDFEEQKAAYNKKMSKYAVKIEELNLELKKPENKDNSAHLTSIELSIKSLEKKKLKTLHEWDHKKLGLINSFAYALSLMVAFAVMTMPFLPIPAATLIIVGVIGTVLCFVLTVISNGIKGGLEIRKEYLSAKEAAIDLNAKINDFSKLLDKNQDLNDDQKILLFLEIKQLLAEKDYHQQMIVYQTMHLVRAMIIQSLIPVLVFVSTVFLPLGIGLGSLAALLTVAVTTNLIIENQFKADKVEFSEFDNAEYEGFCENPDKWVQSAARSKDGFFNGNREKSIETERLLDGKLNPSQ